jgi:ATP-dependent DNA ligase
MSDALPFDLLTFNGEDFRRNPFYERKAALRKILKRTHRGIHCLKETERALSLGSVENVAQDQKSKRASGYEGH